MLSRCGRKENPKQGHVCAQSMDFGEERAGQKLAAINDKNISVSESTLWILKVEDTDDP